MARKVVIDTDYGTDVDDAIAVALAMASPDEIEVQAFTVMGRQSIYRKKMLEDFLSYPGPASPESIFVMCDSAKHSARDFNTVKDDG